MRQAPAAGASRTAESGAAGALADPHTLASLDAYAGQIENFIGTVKVPVGVVGPLRVNGRFAQGDYVIPLATSEAALVASYARGCALISAAGGCTAVLLTEAVQRAPAFIFESLNDACRFAAWLETALPDIRRAAEVTTRHGRLTEISPVIEGNHVHAVFSYETADASGQNMATFATDAALRHIELHAPVTPRAVYIEANLSGDKKACARSFQAVRGRKVSAEVVLPRALVCRRLHTTPERMAEHWRLSVLGSVLSGAIGAQAHVANGLAALFIATGQDAAAVAEAATGVTRFELTPGGDLHAVVTLPNLIVGTVGGGTGLPAQRACLELMGLAGSGHARAFAEATAGLCLAGELSIAGAICAGHFARAHRKLARERRVVP